MHRKTARGDKVEIYLHFIWTTWDRLPLVAESWQEEMHAVIHGAVDGEGCFLLAVGGVEDHVHVVVSVRATTRACDIVKVMKGASAQFGMRQVEGFKWRPTYAVFSVSRLNLPALKRYIRN